MTERLIEAVLPPRPARTWVQAVRPLSFTASIVPAFLGTAVAASQGLFDPGLLLLTLLGGVAVQGAANLFSDYASSRGGDESPDSYGSSRVLVRGLLQPSDILLAGLALTMVAGAIGGYLTVLRGTPILVLGILAALGAYFYSGPPIAYKYRALGNVAIFLLLGPWMVLGAYYIQSSSTELIPILYALPVGCLATAVHHVSTIIRDGRGDGRHGEVTVTRPLGPWPGTLLLSGLLGAAYLLVIAGAAAGGFVWGSALALLSAPLGWMLVRRVATAHVAQDLAMLDVAAARMYLVFGLLLVVGVSLPAP